MTANWWFQTSECHTVIWFTCPCDCLHPLQVLLIIPGVYIHGLPVSLCQFVLFAKSTSGFPCSYFSQSLFVSSPPGFNPCLSWLQTGLPVMTTSLSISLYCFGLRSGFWPLLGLTLGLTLRLPIGWYCLDSDLVNKLSPVQDLPNTYVITNIRAQPSASCACIWVSPCALITGRFSKCESPCWLRTNGEPWLLDLGLQ